MATTHKQAKKKEEEKHTNIENYQMEPFTEKGLKPFLETSAFEVMFPKHREKYVREVEEYIKKAMAQRKLQLFVDYHELVLKVETTMHTRDPYSIIQGRDCLKVLSRGVPLEKAIKVFENDVSYDIIQINIFSRNKETFVKRRERLLGPNGNTVKSLELLTDCYILPYGNTVTAIGHYKSLKEVRRVVSKCMENIHPIYEIKRLMVKRELEKDPNLKNENWERYLPQYKKTHEKKKKKPDTQKTETSEYPVHEERKIDKTIMSGEYFSKSSAAQRSLARKKKKAAGKEEAKSE